MGRWGRLRRLTWQERWVLAEAVALLPISHLLLRHVGMKRTLALLSAVAGRQVVHEGTGTALDHARRLAELLAAAARHGPYAGNCLSRSVTLWYLLRREGLTGHVCLGASRRDGDFAAHAWVEWNGHVLNDGEGVGQVFAPFRYVGRGVGVTKN